MRPYDEFTKDFKEEVKKDKAVNYEKIVKPEMIHALELDLEIRKKFQHLKKK